MLITMYTFVVRGGAFRMLEDYRGEFDPSTLLRLACRDLQEDYIFEKCRCRSTDDTLQTMRDTLAPLMDEARLTPTEFAALTVLLLWTPSEPSSSYSNVLISKKFECCIAPCSVPRSV